MELNIYEIIGKAEAYYKEQLDNYDDILKVSKEQILKIKKELESTNDKDVSFPVTAIYITKDFKNIIAKHLIIIAGFQLEDERQREQKNENDWAIMAEFVLQEFKTFYLMDGLDSEIVSVEELSEILKMNRAKNLFTYIKIFFLSSWVYLILSLLFQIIKFSSLVIICIKPASVEVKKMLNEGTPINFTGIMKYVFDKMPKIFDMEYWYHHEIIGILMWILLVLYILK